MFPLFPHTRKKKKHIITITYLWKFIILKYTEDLHKIDTITEGKYCELECQVRKKSTAKPTPLQSLPTMDQPNQRIHIDLFGPLKTSAHGNKMVLVMTDAFTKYAEAIAIPNKEAETVAMEIFIHWICRFGSPIQIHSDNGTEFVNKLSKEVVLL